MNSNYGKVAEKSDVEMWFLREMWNSLNKEKFRIWEKIRWELLFYFHKINKKLHLVKIYYSTGNHSCLKNVFSNLDKKLRVAYVAQINGAG